MQPPGPPEPTAPSAVELSDFVRGVELGRGGNAAVFLADWTSESKRVALKVIHGELVGDPKYIARFRREVNATSRLQHPHICRVHAFGEEGQKTLWLAMELIEGGSVRDLVDSCGRLPPQVAAVLVDQLLDALGCAHTNGILDRDIKPANAMVNRDGNLKLVDFGIAKGQEDATVTETGFLVGTPAYMSPEQAVGRPVDERSDLYAVGVSFYEMLVGKNPYAEDAPSQALLRIASQPMPEVFESDASVPGALELVLEGLTARHVEDRYRSAEDARRDLRLYLDYVDEVHPNLMARFVADPIAVAAELRQAQAELETARAERLLLAGDANLPAAGLALYRATLLSDEARIVDRYLTVCGRGKLNFSGDDGDDDAIREAKGIAATSPNPAGALKRVADLYRARGNIHRFIVYIRRYLRLRPTDSHALKQLEVCVAGILIPDLGQNGALQTRDILAGVKTGGWAAVPEARKEAAILLQQPSPSVLTSRQKVPDPLVNGLQTNARAAETQHLQRRQDGQKGEDLRGRIGRAAAEEAQRGRSAEPAAEGLGDVFAAVWGSWGRYLLVAGLFLGAFAVVTKFMSKAVSTSVDATQMAISDNQLAVGNIERNDKLRRAGNMLKDAREHYNLNDNMKVIVDVNRLEAADAPADMVLDGILLRARARAKLGQRDAARKDYERFVRQTPLSDENRAKAMDELTALATRESF